MDSANGLGELIVERRNAAGVWFAVLWPAAALAGAGGALALSAAVPKVGLATALFAAVGIMLLAPLLLPRRVLRFYERGLIEALPLQSDKPLRYEEIEHMTWALLKPAVGMTINAELRAAGRRIRFSARMDTGGSHQQKLETARDHIARSVATSARRRIDANQPFAWGPKRAPSVRLQREGIAYRPIGFLGGGEEQIIPWSAPLQFVIREGGFAVFPAENNKAFFSFACGDANFYPGLLLLQSMGKAQQVG
jgi:hypothetical protein